MGYLDINHWWFEDYPEDEEDTTWGDYFMMMIYPWSYGRSMFADYALKQQPWAYDFCRYGLSCMFPELVQENEDLEKPGEYYYTIDWARAMMKIYNITKWIHEGRMWFNRYEPKEDDHRYDLCPRSKNYRGNPWFR